MKKNNINGWIFLDPIGISSNAVLQKLENFGFCKFGYVKLRSFNIRFFPILGDATKTIKYLENKNKEYVFEVEWVLNKLQMWKKN